MPNNDYVNEPNQSRSEEIIQSILDNTEYDEVARSRIEYLLIELKNAIEGGGGGGGVTSYSPLTEKPKIDNHTLQAGNNTSSDLGLQTKIDSEHKLSADNVDDTNSTNKFNVKSDWNAASGATAEILNKPTLGTASAKNVPAYGDAATGEVVLGSDTRLTDARNAKDVYNWAKQENKPSYNYSEIQNPPTIPDELADLADDSTHRTVTDTEKDAWNGKQNALTFDDAPTSNSNNPVKSGGVYTALSGKQNNLSEAQMAAANSGATVDKINKIAVNENNISKCLTLEGGTALTRTADLNNITTIGNYYCSSNTTGQTIANRPTGSSGAFRLTVYFDTGTQYPTQLFDDFSTRKKWERKGNTTGTTFESWALIIDNLADYQKKLSSTTKANADYIDDTSSTNKFATAAQLSQIEINKNNILLIEQANGAKNNLPVTLNSGQISDVTFTVNADKSISTSGTASANITNAYVNISYTIPSTGQWVLLGCPTGGSASASGYRLDMLDGGISGAQVVVDTGEGAVFDKTMFQNSIACVRIRVSNGTNMDNKVFKPMIIPKAMYDAGFTDYHPYALSNAAITPALVECVDNGVKNLLDFSGSTPIAPPNCTMTNNGDGTYTVTKTSENLDTPYIAAQLKAGTYIYSGCPAGGSDSTYRLDIRTSTGSVVGEGDYGSGVKVTIPSDGWYRITCRLNSTYTTTGLTIKPMLCDPALWAISPTFEPHAMSNAELTAKEQTNENNISSKPTRYIIDTGQSNTTTKSFDISTMPNGMYMLTHTNFTGATTKYGISVYMIYLLNGEVDCFTAMKEVNSAIITSITASDNTATITYGTTGYHETTALYLYKN